MVVAVPCELDSNGGASVQTFQDWMTDASAGDYLAAVDGTTVANRSYSFIKMDEHPDAENTTIGQFCMRGRAYICGWSPDITAAKCLGPTTSAIHQGFLLNATDGTLRNSRCHSVKYQCLRVSPSLGGSTGGRAAMGRCDGAGGWKRVPH